VTIHNPSLHELAQEVRRELDQRKFFTMQDMEHTGYRFEVLFPGVARVVRVNIGDIAGLQEIFVDPLSRGTEGVSAFTPAEAAEIVSRIFETGKP
jgi:hypothetical protein